jgi:hypothetical protein
MRKEGGVINEVPVHVRQPFQADRSVCGQRPHKVSLERLTYIRCAVMSEVVVITLRNPQEPPVGVVVKGDVVGDDRPHDPDA